MPKIKPLTTWSLVFYDKHTLKVKIWAERAGMMADVPDIDTETVACFMPNIALLADGGARRIGTVHFVQRDLGGGLVAHELLHGLLAWMVAAHISLTRGEETLCWEMGSLTRQFWRKYAAWVDHLP